MFPSSLVDTSGVAPRELEARAAELCGTINVATMALVEVIAGVVTAERWAGDGYRSIEHWVEVHCGVLPGRARVLVSIARRHAELPVTLGLFREGRLSEDQVRSIAEHVPSVYEASVAELAVHATPNQLRRVARSYHFTGSDDAAAAADEKPVRERFVEFGWDRDGHLTGRFRLPADDGAIVKKGLEASRQVLFQEQTTVGSTDPELGTKVTWADALVRLADAALGAHTRARPARDRHEVVLHVRAEDLDTTQEGERAWLHLGPGLDRSVARAMACDASVRVLLEQAGVPVNEGHKHRTVPPKLRRTIEDRDRGCRVPGCHHTRWLHIHHITHWRDGGPTDSTNLVALCPHHHRLLHHGQLQVTGNPDHPNGLTWTNQRGTVLPNGPPTSPPPHPPPSGRWTHPHGEPGDWSLLHFHPAA